MEKGLNVLSLFDGMSCGQIALERAGIKVNNYFASEIDKDAIFITQKNYPNTIHIGSIIDITCKDFDDIDILIGGSSCQDFSMAGSKIGMSTKDNVEVTSLHQYLELKDKGFVFKGESYLFWEYVRVLKGVKPKYFLLENVIMQNKWKDIISNALGVEPVEINSNLVSAQNRKRLYWSNIPEITLPEDKRLLIEDIIYDDTYKIFTDERITKTKKLTKNYVKWDLSGKKYWSQQDRAYFKKGKMCTMPKASPTNKMNIVLDFENDVYRKLHPVEGERLQTVPHNYTKGVSDAKRLGMLGNGWTVDVIAHIFKNIK